MLKTTEARLSAALLGYVTLIILLLTLNPFYFTRPLRFGYTLDTDIANFIANIILFLPVGFFYRLTSQRRGSLIFGFVLSFAIETMQNFLPARTPSIIDILTNATGSGLGALACDLLTVKLVVPRRAVGRLRLETPLMGLVYLLIPLLWANTLATGQSSNRGLLTVLIGLCGAIIFSELFRHWWEPVSISVGAYAALAVTIWLLLGIGPTALSNVPMLIVVVTLVLLTGFTTVLPRKSTDRRFERATLKWIFPVFGLYLLLLALWYPLRPLVAWHATLGFTDQINETSLQILTPRIEYLVAFTTLGYLLAEWRGRSEIPLKQDLPRLFLMSAGIAIFLEFLVGFQSGPGASSIRAGIAIASALFGGTIYHLLRAHIRYILKH